MEQNAMETQKTRCWYYAGRGVGVGVFFLLIRSAWNETERNETFYSIRKAPRQDAMKGKSPRLQNKIKWQTERTKQTKWMCQQQRDTVTRMKKKWKFQLCAWLLTRTWFDLFDIWMSYFLLPLYLFHSFFLHLFFSLSLSCSFLILCVLPFGELYGL